MASDESVIRLCVNRSRPFIYTSALPAHVAEHAYRRVASKDVLRAHRKRLARNVTLMQDALRESGHPTDSKTHIMPVVIGDERRALRVADHLYRSGIYAPAIRYPTVPRGEARLRISVTAWLEEDAIGAIREALASAAGIA